MKALIKYQNIHIHPTEIEDIILGMDGVFEVGVFGIPEPTVQELVSAAVVKKDGCSITAEDILDHVHRRVEDHQRLRGGVYFVEKVPRSIQGKILRRKIFDEVKRCNPGEKFGDNAGS